MSLFIVTHCHKLYLLENIVTSLTSQPPPPEPASFTFAVGNVVQELSAISRALHVHMPN